MAIPADSADEAIFLFQRLRPDVVLTDIALPIHDGAWLLRQLRTLEQRAPTPVARLARQGMAA